MAVATKPTINTLTIEALKQAGYPNAAADDTLQTRAEIWLQECLGDIWHTSNGKMKSLMTNNLTGITTTDGTSNMEGKAIHNNPSDLAFHIGMSLLSGTHYGVCQAGTDGNTIKLAADEDMSASWAIGRELVTFITATQSTCESAFIRNFNTTTKVCELHDTLSFIPGTTHSYLVVDTISNISEGDIWNYDRATSQLSRGTPSKFHPIIDSDVSISTINEGGQFYLSPVPYWQSDGKLRALRHRYYANLMKLDIDDTAVTKIFAEILTNWRAELTQYIKYKALDSDNKPKAEREKATWEIMKGRLISTEIYGMNMSNLTATVEEQGIED
jgi:hypothetical protein